MIRTGQYGRQLVAGGLLLATLVACGGSSSGSGSKPAVCGDVDRLQTSVQALKDLSIGQGALATLRTDVDQVKQDLATLKADAKAQYVTEIARLTTSLDAVSASVTAAKASPTAAALGLVAASVRQVADAATGLKTAVADTC